MRKKRKICAVTGSRADYDLLYPLLCRLKKEPAITLNIIATGMHLEKKFGWTWRDIEKDKFSITARVPVDLKNDTPAGISASVGSGVERMASVYRRLKPDILVLLGDRFEIFASSVAALISRIPIAHLHGGEATFGAFDEALRHSITKMSHLHFTSTREYRRRVIQLGEDPSRVFCVGALGIDNIVHGRYLSQKETEEQIGFTFDKRNLLVTFHPVTLENDTAGEQFEHLIEVLDELKNTRIVFTSANADTAGSKINRLISKYTKRNRGKAVAVASLGRLRYLSLLSYVDAVIGNSSSGIIEAPSFGIGTINIGDRQKGRIRAKSVIDCRPDKTSLRRAFRELYSPSFQKILKRVTNPYGKGDAAKKIAKVLKTHRLDGILKKEFRDVKFSY